MRRIVSQSFPKPLISNAENIGTAIRAARTQANLGIRDAALLVGVAVQTLSDIEAGKPGVALGNVLKVAEGLGVDLFVVSRRHRGVVQNRLADLPS